MKLRWKSWMAGVLTAAWLLEAWLGNAAEPRFIRLRNERIDTSITAPAPSVIPSVIPSATPTATPIRQAQGGTPASGLFLIQFRDHLQPTWRAELATSHVDLLQYVPDDAFVARFEGVNLAQLQSSPHIRWVGPYKPEYKLHNSLSAAAQARQPGSRPITVLLSSKATPDEANETRRLFLSIQQQATYDFGTVLRGLAPDAALQSFADSQTVLWIEPGPRFKLNDEISSHIVGGDGGGHATLTQDLGFNGDTVCVAVADSGLHAGQASDMHPDLFGRVVAFFFYGALADASDRHGHGTHVAGIIAGNAATGETDEFGALYGLGVAPGATVVAQRMFDADGNYEAPPSFEVLTHDAVRAGADIGNNSWVDDTQGRYDVSAAEFDALVRDADEGTAEDQPYVVVFSAGNAGAGAQTIGSPAVAKNVIATGASQNNRSGFLDFDEGPEAMAYFSSRGPAEDGRIKPDLVAPGTWIASLRSKFANNDNARAVISENYLYQEGTSQAAPHVSGAAAVFVQYYRETYAGDPASPALVKAALINSAVDMDDSFGTGPVPNMDEGWGRVDISGIVVSQSAREYVDQSVTLTTGQVYERRVIIRTPNQPLNITMAYTDYPGFPAVLPALVNDLDLEVIAPDGRIYHGNQFELGESVPDAPAFDNLNNVEGIHISAPLAGDYRVRVIANNVVQDSRRETPAVDQDFALVVCGDILPPETGIVLLDRAAYRAPGVANIKLIDADLMGQPSATITLRSATEPGGFSFVLRPQNSSGTFTGSVATALAPAINDNQLQLHHGDWIHAEYFDVSDSVLLVATATADLQPPVISQVGVTNQFGRTIVTWLTDEPANSVARSGTNSASLLRATTNLVITTQHAMELTNLVAGRTYYYRVESTDTAGNTATNSGGVISFVAQPTATVLLVNNYVPDTEVGSPFIPLSSYTNILSQIGVSFDVWNATSNNSALPTFGTLRPYPIVMWRVNDSYNRTESIPTAQQNALQQYLNSGGAFFMASMEIIDRLPSGTFRSNVLHIQSFSPTTDPNGCPCLDCDEDVGIPGIVGALSDPISRDIGLTLNYDSYPSKDIFVCTLGPDLSDTFLPSTNAASFLFSVDSGKTCGVRYPRTGQDSTGRVVFCSFPLDAIPETGPTPNNRAAFLRNALQFIAPGLGGLGSIALGQGTYRLPDLVTVEIADSDLAGQTGPQVRFHSDSDPSLVTITLQETPQPGLFRGFVPLISATNPPAAGRLRATHGDRIYASYYDASGGTTIETAAYVDNVPPVIVGIAVVPGYDDALITWSTDDPTDALVQFGESTFLSRTAYNPDLVTDHQVHLTGLSPDRLYYFQVVSRDAAGNTRTESSGPDLLSFETLVPVMAPFTDHFENASPKWDTFTGQDSDTEWTVGSPNNGVQSQAHSPLNCWGSSRLGASCRNIDTFLISPAIDLSGGNVAHLRFWHSYDFTEKTTFDLSEDGELLLITNSLTAPISLGKYFDSNSGWEEVNINLTPYVGRVIFLVWHHQLRAFESAERAGWLVDDVSITMETLPPVTIRITNNLAQSRYFLSGQVTRSEQGYGSVLTNLPPGDYSISFSTVPYYITPAPQSNSIPSGGFATFTGNYTFPDANGNGISDIWEQQYFGSVGNHPGSLDGDGDGFTDYSEFIAGTNPTLPNSRLRISSAGMLPSGKLQFQWPAVPGRIYQVQGSVNLGSWIPLSPWIQAGSNTLSYAQTAPTPGPLRLFRLEVRP